MTPASAAFAEKGELITPPVQATQLPPMQARVAIAVGGALVAFTLAFLRFRGAPDAYAGDFTWHWRAGRAMLDGTNPSQVINTLPYYPFNSGYYYLLPTPLIVAPVAAMAPHLNLRGVVGRNAPLILTYCVPAAILVLLRRNVGRVPSWMERASNVLLPWLRGSAT
jgi:hypothetical protein